MISDKTQDKLDRASEGLPMDDEQQQAEADIKEMAEFTGMSEDEVRAIKEDREWDDVAEKEARDHSEAMRYEQSRENDNSL